MIESYELSDDEILLNKIADLIRDHTPTQPYSRNTINQIRLLVGDYGQVTFKPRPTSGEGGKDEQ